jgi:hypothetical protein
MVAAHSSEISVTIFHIFETTWSHPKNNNLQVAMFQRKLCLHILVDFFNSKDGAGCSSKRLIPIYQLHKDTPQKTAASKPPESSNLTTFSLLWWCMNEKIMTLHYYHAVSTAEVTMY